MFDYWWTYFSSSQRLRHKFRAIGPKLCILLSYIYTFFLFFLTFRISFLNNFLHLSYFPCESFFQVLVYFFSWIQNSYYVTQFSSKWSSTLTKGWLLYRVFYNPPFLPGLPEHRWPILSYPLLLGPLGTGGLVTQTTFLFFSTLASPYFFGGLLGWVKPGTTFCRPQPVIGT